MKIIPHFTIGGSNHEMLQFGTSGKCERFVQLSFRLKFLDIKKNNCVIYSNRQKRAICTFIIFPNKPIINAICCRERMSVGNLVMGKTSWRSFICQLAFISMIRTITKQSQTSNGSNASKLFLTPTGSL